jgi:hypothetical protein
MQVEINGVIVAANVNSPSQKKLNVAGSAADLRIRAGSNRIRVVSPGGQRSNILVAAL